MKNPQRIFQSVVGFSKCEYSRCIPVKIADLQIVEDLQDPVFQIRCTFSLIVQTPSSLEMQVLLAENGLILRA